MKKKISKKKPISNISMINYCIAILGYGAKLNVGLYEMVCEGLASQGMPKPESLSYKQWVFENCAYVVSEASRNKEKVKAYRIKRKSSRVYSPDPQPVLQPVKIEVVTTPLSPCQLQNFGKRPYPIRRDAEFIQSKEFLQSFEWRALRLEVLKRDKMKCQCCGASPKTGAVMNVDHIKPRKYFPELALDPGNLQTLCVECNHGKGNWDHTDFRVA